MVKYHIVIENEQKGPFSLEEIFEMGISRNTLVWNENMKDWTEAQNVEDFIDILKKTRHRFPVN